MINFILVSIYLTVCLLLIIVILLQQDKTAGGGMGAAFGGSSQTVFGSHSGDILSKATNWLAVGFIVLALLLTFTFTKRSSLVQDAGTVSSAPVTESLPAPEAEK